MDRLGLRHRPSGLNTRFLGDAMSFSDYVRRTQEMLRRAHAGEEGVERIVAGNSPFELRPQGDFARGRNKPYRRGVLLTHGLTDSPYSMKHLAGFFQRNGFRVMAELLPGHGTRPGDLLDVRWRQWAKAVAYGAECLAAEVDELYLAGLSTGATLSVLHGLRDPRVRGLLLFSPAIAIVPKARYANAHRWYSWLRPQAKWVTVKPDTDIYKYESFPKNGAAQVYALCRELRRQLRTREPDLPIFAAASLDDATVETPATLEFMARARHPSSRFVLYARTPDDLPPGIPKDKLEMVNSVVPAQRILSSAHTAVVTPPEDPYYGAAGEYVNCAHYYPEEMNKYEACKNRSADVLQGEITEANRSAGILRRLTYNPNYAALEISMQRFLDELA